MEITGAARATVWILAQQRKSNNNVKMLILLIRNDSVTDFITSGRSAYLELYFAHFILGVWLLKIRLEEAFDDLMIKSWWSPEPVRQIYTYIPYL